MKQIKAYVEKSDYGFSVYMEDNDLDYGIIGEGKTATEAINDFRQAYEEMREYYKDEGKNFEEVNFEFVYDIASFLQYYAFAFTLAGLERITGINQRQLSHYINGVSKPTRRTIEKIENGIHNFSRDLSMVKFILSAVKPTGL